MAADREQVDEDEAGKDEGQKGGAIRLAKALARVECNERPSNLQDEQKDGEPPGPRPEVPKPETGEQQEQGKDEENAREDENEGASTGREDREPGYDGEEGEENEDDPDEDHEERENRHANRTAGARGRRRGVGHGGPHARTGNKRSDGLRRELPSHEGEA